MSNINNNSANTTTMAIVLIALAVMLIGGLAVTTGPTTALQKAFAEPQRPDRFAGSDRCVTSQDQSTDFTTTTCFFGTDREDVKERSKEAQESCKDAKEQGEVDKCSSSQTGNGEFCNFAKVRQDKVASVFDPEAPPCKEVNQRQNEFLNDK